IPGFQRLLITRRLNSVISLRQVGREWEIIRIETDCFSIKFQSAIKDLLLVDAVEFLGILSKEENGCGEILVVNGLLGVQFDGFCVVNERIGDRTAVAV